MNNNPKTVETLEIADFIRHPVWEYINDDEIGETAVRPVDQYPVDDVKGRIVGSEVQLANGNYISAMIGNVDVGDPRATEHFLTLSVERGGKWFTLSRYHDFDYANNGPEALGRFLRVPIDAVFPIHYDITKLVIGDPRALAGNILIEPRERLTRANIIAL